MFQVNQSTRAMSVRVRTIFVTKLDRAPMLHDIGANSLHNVLDIGRNKSVG